MPLGSVKPAIAGGIDGGGSTVSGGVPRHWIAPLLLAAGALLAAGLTRAGIGAAPSAAAAFVVALHAAAAAAGAAEGAAARAAPRRSGLVPAAAPIALAVVS